jgi:hypothetical protein
MGFRPKINYWFPASKLSPKSPAQIIGILIFWKIFLWQFVTKSKMDYETEALQTNEKKNHQN